MWLIHACNLRILMKCSGLLTSILTTYFPSVQVFIRKIFLLDWLTKFSILIMVIKFNSSVSFSNLIPTTIVKLFHLSIKLIMLYLTGNIFQLMVFQIIESNSYLQRIKFWLLNEWKTLKWNQLLLIIWYIRISQVMIIQ